jgi:hypothetical protein
MTKTKIILDDLTDDEAWALAQMAKRLIRDDFRRLSAGRVEREDMDSATIKPPFPFRARDRSGFRRPRVRTCRL